MEKSFNRPRNTNGFHRWHRPLFRCWRHTLQFNINNIMTVWLNSLLWRFSSVHVLELLATERASPPVDVYQSLPEQPSPGNIVRRSRRPSSPAHFVAAGGRLWSGSTLTPLYSRHLASHCKYFSLDWMLGFRRREGGGGRGGQCPLKFKGRITQSALNPSLSSLLRSLSNVHRTLTYVC